MPRDLENINKGDLIHELADKHGIEVSEQANDPAEIIAEFGGLLDTTTEEEREQSAREAVEAENESAPASEEVARLYEAPKVEPILATGEVEIIRWQMGEGGQPERVTERFGGEAE